MLVPEGRAPDADQVPILELVRVVTTPHDPHGAVRSLREVKAMGRGTVVVYHQWRYIAGWGAEYTTALAVLSSFYGFVVYRRPHKVRQPR